MMNSWKRYTIDISALMTVGRSFRVTRGQGYVFAGLMDTTESPYIARYSGNHPHVAKACCRSSTPFGRRSQ